MKFCFRLLFIALAFCLLACSAPEKPEEVLKRLMETKMPGVKFENGTTPGALRFTSDGKDNIYFGLEGRYRMRNDQLIVTISEWEDSDERYFTGIFKSNGTTWESLFSADLIPGKLDTLLDLNGDGADEIILDEYEKNSAGFDSYQFLYAKKENSFLEKIDTLSRQYLGPLAFYFVKSDRSYEKEGNETILTIQVVKSDFTGETQSPVETSSAYTFRWQPPNLIKEKINLESQRDVAEFSDPLTEDLVVAGFLTKWFPLTESDGKLKRQQLCGVESFIEIMANDQHTWREQGYQDVSEASVEAFMAKGEGDYLITLKLSDGSKKEIKCERNLEVDFVYTIDGRSYTNQPDKFEVVNDTEECGN